MFMDELSSLERGRAVDSLCRKSRASVNQGNLKKEREFNNPTAGRRNMAAAGDELTGLPWWKRPKQEQK